VHTTKAQPREPSATNPAIVSPLIESLFPAGVAAAELRVAGDPGLLEPEEAAAVARAVAKRVREFAAGRLCARRALQRFGIARVVLPVAHDRQPIWPPGFLGSITHTEGFCAAVAAARGAPLGACPSNDAPAAATPRYGDHHSARLLGLGLDSEAAGAVEAHLWPSLCVASELDWIAQWPAEARKQAATLVFAAKEAFYKAQYPTTGEFMSFADLEVAPCAPQALEGPLIVAPTRALAVFAGDAEPARALGSLFPCRVEVRARYRFHEGFVSAGVALCAARAGTESEFR
jgi:4'-phosphopantetheinyl transferase EntD